MEWTGDGERWRVAGVPGDTAFATKIALARRMVERAVKTNLPA